MNTGSRSLDDLSAAEKRKLLEQLMERKAKKSRSYRASFAQERLWFLEQLNPGLPTYNLPGAHRLIGPLNVTALEQSVNEIVRRHEALRTTFPSVDGQVIQHIAPALTVKLTQVDLEQFPEMERQSKLQRLITERIQPPFDLAHGPLLRVTILRVAAEEHVLLVTMHHIISDGWSMGVFLRELGTIYETFPAGNSSLLEDLPIQYSDFSRWQRESLKGDALEAQVSYWRGQLGDNLPVLELPTDRPRPLVQTYPGARQPLRLDKTLSEGLAVLSREEGVSLYMTLLAVFQVLLFRHSGQENIVIGTPIACRNRPEIEGLIGFFANMLVLRTNLSANPRFRDVLHQVRKMTLGAYDHQDLPFEKLVEELRSERDPSRSPLFQVIFSLQVVPATQLLKLPGMKWSAIEAHNGMSKFDLSVYLWDQAGEISGTIEYNTDLFDTSTIARLIGHYQNLLSGVVANRDQRLSDLPLLTEPERRQLLVEWNDTVREYPREESIHALFEEQVERAPEATAVVFEDQQITYRELNRRANQLGHYLRTLGVGPEMLVGIMMERSVEMVVGLLGILKAGGAYVPLDPDYPQDRLDFMIQDSGMSVLLTQASLKERQQGVDGWSAVGGQRSAVDSPEVLMQVNLDEWGAIAEQPSANVQSAVYSANLAYVIYTSGSTGQPKGVQIRHGSLVNFLRSMADEPGICSDDVLLSVTTLSFDIAGLELFLPLVSGARTVLVSREVSTDGDALRRQLDDVSVMQATPATWRLLVESDWAGSPHLRVLCGGEALAPNLAEELVERSQALWNLYGPTETAVWSTVYPVMPVSGDTSVAIGRPISNTAVYLTDGSLNPVPVGVAGALLIGGAGVARGYLNRPNPSADRFVPDPFREMPGERLYRTGDRAHYKTDGNIEFLGRMDHQVKIRGFRIEPGEIEIALIQYPQVRHAVVVARSGPTGDRRPGTGDGDAEPRVPNPEHLVAYVISEPGVSPAVSDLRQHLSERLPDYMMPQVFVMLEETPLTPNSKVDRKALAEPDGIRPDLEQAYVTPRTETEELLAGIWSEVLRVEEVGIHDDFFDLGGHSLLATQVVSRVRAAFAVDIPLRTLFEAPTIEALAKSVNTIHWATKTLERDPLLKPDEEEATF